LHLLLTVEDGFGGQLTTPLVKLLVSEHGPVGARTKPIDFLVDIGDVADQIVTGGNKAGGNKGCHGVVHRGNTLYRQSGKHKNFL